MKKPAKCKTCTQNRFYNHLVSMVCYAYDGIKIETRHGPPSHTCKVLFSITPAEDRAKLLEELNELHFEISMKERG